MVRFSLRDITPLGRLIVLGILLSFPGLGAAQSTDPSRGMGGEGEIETETATPNGGKSQPQAAPKAKKQKAKKAPKKKSNKAPAKTKSKAPAKAPSKTKPKPAKPNYTYYGTKPSSVILGIQPGFHLFENNQVFLNDNLLNRGFIGMRLGYALVDHLDIEGSFDFLVTESGGVTVNNYLFHGGLVGNLLAGRVWTPYASIALGGYQVGTSQNSDFTRLSLAYAVGVKYFFLESIALRFEARGITVFEDEVTNLQLSVGLVGYIPLKDYGDRDNDGIPDREDKCPDKAEDKDGFADQDGCPDFDNDGDGIPDHKDKCPNVPEDKDGIDDNDGCPDNDNDGDGIPDASDACPSSPEDRDGFQDDDGCPDLDNDGDGIPDAKDKCPNDPETINDYLDEDGCPDEKPSLKEFTGPIRGIQMAFDSPIIDIVSYELLDRFVEIFKAHKDKILVIEAHTDSTGSRKYNYKLSRERAESVRQYLISRGISAFRIRIDPKGEERPIASNKTETGRALNRRIEFRFLKAEKPTAGAKQAPAKASPKAKTKAKPKPKKSKAKN